MKTEQELLSAVLDARKKSSSLEDLLKQADEEKRRAEVALIEYMDERDLKSFKSTAYPCNVTRRETLYVSMSPEHKEEALRFIEEDCGRGDIIKKSVHNKTLSSFIGKRLKEAEQVPEDLFSYFWKPELSITMGG